MNGFKPINYVKPKVSYLPIKDEEKENKPVFQEIIPQSIAPSKPTTTPTFDTRITTPANTTTTTPSKPTTTPASTTTTTPSKPTTTPAFDTRQEQILQNINLPTPENIISSRKREAEIRQKIDESIIGPKSVEEKVITGKVGQVPTGYEFRGYVLEDGVKKSIFVKKDYMNDIKNVNEAINQINFQESEKVRKFNLLASVLSGGSSSPTEKVNEWISKKTTPTTNILQTGGEVKSFNIFGEEITEKGLVSKGAFGEAIYQKETNPFMINTLDYGGKTIQKPKSFTLGYEKYNVGKPETSISSFGKGFFSEGFSEGFRPFAVPIIKLARGDYTTETIQESVFLTKDKEKDIITWDIPEQRKTEFFYPTYKEKELFNIGSDIGFVAGAVAEEGAELVSGYLEIITDIYEAPEYYNKFIKNLEPETIKTTSITSVIDEGLPIITSKSTLKNVEGKEFETFGISTVKKIEPVSPNSFKITQESITQTFPEYEDTPFFGRVIKKPSKKILSYGEQIITPKKRGFIEFETDIKKIGLNKPIKVVELEFSDTFYKTSDFKKGQNIIGIGEYPMQESSFTYFGGKSDVLLKEVKTPKLRFLEDTEIIQDNIIKTKNGFIIKPTKIKPITSKAYDITTKSLSFNIPETTKFKLSKTDFIKTTGKGKQLTFNFPEFEESFILGTGKIKTKTGEVETSLFGKGQKIITPEEKIYPLPQKTSLLNEEELLSNKILRKQKEYSIQFNEEIYGNFQEQQKALKENSIINFFEDFNKKNAKTISIEKVNERELFEELRKLTDSTQSKATSQLYEEQINIPENYKTSYKTNVFTTTKPITTFSLKTEKELERKKTITLQEITPIQNYKTITLQEIIPIQNYKTLTRQKITPMQDYKTLTRQEIIPIQDYETLTRQEIIPMQDYKTLTRQEITPMQDYKTLTRQEIIPIQDYETITGIDITPIQDYKTITGIQDYKTIPKIDITPIQDYKTIPKIGLGKGYTPDIKSIIFNITGAKPKTTTTGFESRPVIKTKKKKKEVITL